MARPDIEVMVAGGDGDGYSIGAGHFVHAVRRNVDMTYVVMDNRIYGLTKGQASPTSREDFETSTSPEGPKQPPVNPHALALASGATFIAQSFSSDALRHQEIIQKAVEHDGFGFVNVYSPCVTFNDVDTYDYFRDSLVDLKESDHDPSDKEAAKDVIFDDDTEHQGIIYQDEESRCRTTSVTASTRTCPSSRTARPRARRTSSASSTEPPPSTQAVSLPAPRSAADAFSDRDRDRDTHRNSDLSGSPKSGDPAGSQPVCDRFQQA